MSSSLACLSPSLVRRSSSMVSSLRRTFSFEVFTPQISTLPCTGIPPGENLHWQFSLAGGDYAGGKMEVLSPV